LQLIWIADFLALRLEAERQFALRLQVRRHNLAQPFRRGRRTRHKQDVYDDKKTKDG
jgi:hypothetical protein